MAEDSDVRKIGRVVRKTGHLSRTPRGGTRTEIAGARCASERKDDPNPSALGAVDMRFEIVLEARGRFFEGGEVVHRIVAQPAEFVAELPEPRGVEVFVRDLSRAD